LSDLLDSVLKEIPQEPPKPAPAPSAAAEAPKPGEDEHEVVPPAPGQQTGKTIHNFNKQFESIYGPRKFPPKGAPGTG
jgi:hypothetical protein